MAAAIAVRPPSNSGLPQPAFTPPAIDWLSGTWHVTHSTLPMWKSKRNVAITYKSLLPTTPSPAQDATNKLDDIVSYQTLVSDKVKTVTSIDTASGKDKDATNKLDDIVSYQTLVSDKVKTVTGIDTASGKDTGAWDWRGKGMLMIASSHWEVLGYGDLEAGQQWAVTFFAKTLFTPAGIDIYSRTKEGLSEAVLTGITEALASVEHEPVKKLAAEIFEVKRD